MNCPNCNAVNNDGAQFCTSCGAQLAGAPAASAPRPPPHLIYPTTAPAKSKKPIIAILAIAVVVVVIIAAAAASTSGETDSARYDYALEIEEKFTYEVIPGYPSDVTPSAGNHFIVATVKVVNDRDISIETNSFMWEFSSGGIDYTSSAWTYFADLVDYQSVAVGEGGSVTFQIIYEVPISVTSGTISYTGPYSYALERDNSLL